MLIFECMKELQRLKSFCTDNVLSVNLIKLDGVWSIIHKTSLEAACAWPYEYATWEASQRWDQILGYTNLSFGLMNNFSL